MKAPKKTISNAAIFNAQSEDSVVIGAEITVADGNHYGTFITSNAIDLQAFNTIAKQAGVEMQISSATKTPDDGNIFVVKSSDDLSKLVAAFNENGATLTSPEPEKPAFNPWKWRAYTSMVGQGLQIASSFAAKGNSPDKAAMATFGTLNLMANGCNYYFGSQHNNDDHQLAFLKQQFTQAISPLVEDASRLPQIDYDPTKSRLSEYPKKSFGEQLYDTAKHYSVSAGEVGLRAIGSFGLSYPSNKWGEMIGHLMQGNVMMAHEVGHNTNQVTYNAGIANLIGKATSLLAKEEDPFNPKDKNIIDTFREKIAFRLSSIIEGGAAFYMLRDRLNMVEKPEQLNAQGVMEKPAPNEMKCFSETLNKNDYLGAAGNAVFIGGYGIRLTAPYGTLDVNMKHLYAHISDCLNEVPKEILPQTLMASAASLKNHFADSKLTFTEIYSGIADDLLHHHGVDVAMWEQINHQNMAKMEQRMNAITQPNTSQPNTSLPEPNISDAQMMGVATIPQVQLAI